MWGPVMSSSAQLPGASSTGLRLSRFTVAVVLDALIVVVAFHLALLAQFAGRPPAIEMQELWRLLAYGVAAFLLTNLLFGIYHRIWRFAGFSDLLTLVASALVATLTTSVVNSYWLESVGLSPGTVLLGGFLSLAGLCTLRYRRQLAAGVLQDWRPGGGLGSAEDRHRVLVVGAGEAGRLLIDRFEAQREGDRYEPVGLVDDDPAKLGLRFRGLKVLGDRRSIPEVVERHDVNLIVIAIYNVSGQDFREIVDICEQTDAVIKVLPNLFDFLQGTNGAAPLRDVTVEDLLGRSVVEIDDGACRQLLAEKTVLVTGAAGSIGSELCRQVLRFGPSRLVMVDNNESGLHELVVGELDGRRQPFDEPDEARDTSLVSVVGDITKPAKMRTVFAKHRPDIVFHAAAYKHVPLMEDHPDEAVRVNILGTWECAKLAASFDVDRFVLVSTDKAINPTSVMGASKRVCELLVTDSRSFDITTQAAGILFTAVRFGNVLGSRGSVVPTFERQIAKGGPVTITHPEMTRYFMSIAEAASLIIQAAVLTKGDDLFMLDMGQRIRIDDLARRMIRMRGLRPGVDVPIVYTGPRSGEKMHEELLGDGELNEPTAHPHIFRIRSAAANSAPAAGQQLQHLIGLADSQNADELVSLLGTMVRSPVGHRQLARKA